MMHLVESAVEPGYFVMQKMPYKVLEVKEKQAGSEVPDDSQDPRCHRWVADGSPVPVQDAQREDVHSMIVEGEREAAPNHSPRHVGFLLNLVSPYQCYPGRQGIQNDKRQAEAHVDCKREEHREIWRP